MVFSELTFIFFFLPAALLIYYLCPGKIKNAVLFLISIIFYAWGEPKYVWIMLFSAVFDYVNGLLLGKTDSPRKRKVVLAVSVVGNLSILAVFKYVGNYVGIALPIGISFYTFQTMSYTIDVYRRKVMPNHNFLDFAAYVTMFPQLIAGPIVRYETVEKQLKNRVHSIDKFAEGIKRFVTGLGKKVIFANMAGQLWEYANTSAAENTAVLAWLGAIGYTFQIYFDFSGYSDMAIGLGKMFGFDYEENFNYPYMGRSITGFWRRWHISLSSWFKEYVYIPLGGNKRIINILIVWTLTGIWHGATPNFLAWGMYYGILLIIEKKFLGEILEKIPAVFSHIYMMLIVIMGWVLFAIDDWSLLCEFIKGMFGANGFVDARAIYQFGKYAVMIVMMIAGCTYYPAKISQYITGKMKPAIKVAVSNIFYLAVFALSIALIVGDSYNPFLYFRF